MRVNNNQRTKGQKLGSSKISLYLRIGTFQDTRNPEKELNVKSPLGEILFADVIQKINRSDGKTQDLVLVLTTGPQIFLLSTDSLKVKYKIQPKDINSILMSPYCDGTCAIKISSETGKEMVNKWYL